MSKLWIVHRSPSVRAALARLSGLAPARCASGASLDEFPADEAPGAVLIAVDDDPDEALELARAARLRNPDVRFVVLGRRGSRPQLERLFGSHGVSLLETPPDSRRLRDAVAAALTRDGVASLAIRRLRSGLERRFDAWFAGTGIVGLERAFDPRLAGLPLLVRGRPGSGRSLLLERAELARRGEGPRLRLAARELLDPSALVARLGPPPQPATNPIRTLWVDAIDELEPAQQRRLADWITHGLPTDSSATAEAFAHPLRWLATAGETGLGDGLEPVLARAFVPLTLCIPPLDRRGDALARLADHVAQEWVSAVGGPPRAFSPGALAALAEEPEWLDRAEFEAILRATLAATASARIEALDLRFPDEANDPERAASWSSSGGLPPESDAPSPLGSDPRPLESLGFEPGLDPSRALQQLTEAWQTAGAGADEEEKEDEVARHAPLDPTWRKLARSLAHEIRNPLVSIRTFTELLPEHHADPTFRKRFHELVGKDVTHIQGVVALLARAASRDVLESRPVDVSTLLDRLLAARRDRISKHRLVVLAELDRQDCEALGDPDALETALAGLLDRALDSLPDRGDLYLSARRIGGNGGSPARIRVCLRHHDPGAAGQAGELDPVQNVLEYVLAETIVHALGGRMTMDPTLGPETFVVIDLPTPALPPA